MINCIVVDDEPPARQLIASYIRQVPGMQCLGEYQGAVEAFAELHAEAIDAIFIDIEMPGINGLNFIRSLKTPPKVVFITAYAEYAVDAFEIEAIDYLIKPVTMERFLKTTRKLLPMQEQNTPTQEIPSIFLKIDKRLVRIDLDDILYVAAQGDYLKVSCREKTFLVYMPLGKLEALLPAHRFIRIHRSTIVGMKYISFIEGNFVRVNNEDFTIGLTYRDSVIRSVGSGQ